jgi:hypothetical protein
LNVTRGDLLEDLPILPNKPLRPGWQGFKRRS